MIQKLCRERKWKFTENPVQTNVRLWKALILVREGQPPTNGRRSGAPGLGVVAERPRREGWRERVALCPQPRSRRRLGSPPPSRCEPRVSRLAFCGADGLTGTAACTTGVATPRISPTRKPGNKTSPCPCGDSASASVHYSSSHAGNIAACSGAAVTGLRPAALVLSRGLMALSNTGSAGMGPEGHRTHGAVASDKQAGSESRGGVGRCLRASGRAVTNSRRAGLRRTHQSGLPRGGAAGWQPVCGSWVRQNSATAPRGPGSDPRQARGHLSGPVIRARRGVCERAVRKGGPGRGGRRRCSLGPLCGWRVWRCPQLLTSAAPTLAPDPPLGARLTALGILFPRVLPGRGGAG